MSDSATQQTLGEQPANNDQVTNAGAQPQTGNITERFESLSAEQQAAILFAEESDEPDSSQSAQATPTPPSEERNQETDTDQNAGENQTADDANAQQPDPSKAAPKRVSVRALPDDQQVLVARAVEMVRNGKAANFLAATAILAEEAGITVAQAATDPNAGEQIDDTATQQTTNHQPETPTAKIGVIQDEIKALQLQLQDSIKTYDVEAQADLTVQIQEKYAELSEVKATAVVSEAKQQEQVSAYQQEYEATVEQIEARYPELHDANSNFSRVFDGLVAKARQSGDAMLQDPTHLAAIADEVSEMLNVPPVTTNTQTRTPLPAPPPRVMPTGSAVAPGHTQASRMGSDDVMRFIQNATPDQLRELVDA